MPSSTFQRLWHLSRDEKVYLLMYPEHAVVINMAAQQALRESERRFGFQDHNGKGDAFRHCFWSAMLCRELGYNSALRYTLAHEASPNNPPLEKAMDLHNNAIGLRIGQSGGPDHLLSNRSMSALRSGQLNVLG